MKWYLFFCVSIVILAVSCQKDKTLNSDDPNKPSDTTKTNPTPPSLTVSRPVIDVGTLSGYVDTFTVKSDIDWVITLSAGAESWLKLDTMKGGSGGTVIKLSVLASNITTTATCTITISPLSASTVPPKSITVKQQIYSLIWQKAFGPTYSNVLNVIQDADGGLVFSGSTNPGWLFKTDSNGNLLWQTNSNSPSGNLSSVAKTPDGGYVATGWRYPTSSVNTGQDVAVVKFNASGSIIWEKYFGGNGDETGQKIITTVDGGYLISALTYSGDGDVIGNRGNGDIWLLKVDANGNKVWAKTFGGSGYDYDAGITATSDGGFLLAGSSSSKDGDMSGVGGGTDLVVFKLDASGNKIWTKIYGGSKDDYPNNIIATKDGGCIMVGSTNSNDGDASGLHGSDYDMWLLKLDNNGQKTWQATLGSTGWDEGASITEMPDGSYMALGFTYGDNGDVDGNHGNEDLWVVKLSSAGKKLWQRPIGSPANDIPDAINATSDGGFVITGFAGAEGGDMTSLNGASRGWVVKFK